MANNRLWLVHRPSGQAICLGKRMAVGWYLPVGSDDLSARLEAMFNAIDDDMSKQDDFVLCIEDGRDAPWCCDTWHYEDHKPVIDPTLKPLEETDE